MKGLPGTIWRIQDAAGNPPTGFGSDVFKGEKTPWFVVTYYDIDATFTVPQGSQYKNYSVVEVVVSGYPKAALVVDVFVESPICTQARSAIHKARERIKQSGKEGEKREWRKRLQEALDLYYADKCVEAKDLADRIASRKR